MQDRFNVRFWDIEEKLYLYPDCYMQTAWNIGLGNRKTPLLYELWSCNKYIPQQCTGLRDKNGKLIYEGDIVKVPEDYSEFGQFAGEKYEVYFKAGGFRFKPKFDEKARGCWLEDENTFEVLGNIYENPELLTEEVQA